jgi:hypothetical protein
MEAQKEFVENDDKAVLIEFEDLSEQFYHLDPVALLITGNRLANTWSTILPDPDYVLPSKYDDDDTIVESIAGVTAILLVTLIVVRCWLLCRIRQQENMVVKEYHIININISSNRLGHVVKRRTQYVGLVASCISSSGNRQARKRTRNPMIERTSCRDFYMDYSLL